MITELACYLAIAQCTAYSPCPNVLLVALDQLRADHLHCYGYYRETSPNIDRLTRDGVMFTHMYAPASWTTPSFVSVMTQLFPSRHRLTLFCTPKAPLLDPSIPLLAEQFKEAGYRTIAFVNNGNAGRHILERGFDKFYQGQEVPPNVTERIDNAARAPGTTQKVTAWLKRYIEESPSQPFFMFLLYFEPHSPYNPPPEHDIFKTDAYPEQRFTGYGPRDGCLLRWATIGDAKAIERLNGLYDGFIHFVDFHFGRLLDVLHEMGLEENTVVALFSDHGELLYEHPDVLTFDHRSLYDANIRVPFIIRGPGIPKGKVVDAIASLIDVAPTLLEVSGLPPMSGAQGKSLLPLIKGRRKSAHRYVFSEQDICERLRCIRDERYKLIYNLDTGRIQLFDMLADPAERDDIATQEPKVVRRLMRELKRWMEENHPPEQERLQVWLKTVEADPKVTVVDDVTIGAQLQLIGPGWRMANHESNFRGASFWVEPDVDGSNIAIWRTDNPLLGTYDIYIWYGAIPGRKAATNARYTIVTRTESSTFVINQNENTGRWNLLGRFDDPLYVRLTSAADGPIIVDAVKFERVGNDVREPGPR